MNTIKETEDFAKLPAFYSKFGWKEMERETAPDISKWQTCEDFGVS